MIKHYKSSFSEFYTPFICQKIQEGTNLRVQFLTQQQVAEICDVGRRTVINFENFKYFNVKLFIFYVEYLPLLKNNL